MGRPEAPLDARAGPVQEFAARLRRLRADTGGRSYRQLAKAANFAAPTLARAASGHSFPSWDVTRAYVTACGADPDQWRSVWAATARLVGLAGHDGDRAPAGGAVRQLPADLPDFTGRAAECDSIRRVAEVPERTGVTAGAPTVVVISGPGGIGKTTLAVRAAYLVADRYPDGQLFVDLRGQDDQPDTPAQVALRFLAALAMPVDRRSDPVTAFRSAVAGRRLLMVLDNAAGEDQVSSLLPAAAGSLVIVTSRQALGALPTTRTLRLEALDLPAAVQLLSRIAGDDLTGHPAQTAALARLCGCLPLALRIAASRLACDPGGTVGLLVDRLRDEEHRLRHLTAGGHDLRIVFGSSYHRLAEIQRHVFHRAGLFPGPDLSLTALVILAGRDPVDVESAVRRLVDASLIQQAGPDRYRLHDLLRIYAARQGEAADDATARTAAIRRLAQWYLGIVDAADREVMPARGRPGTLPGAQQPVCAPASPMAWYDAERANLIAVTRAAASHGHHDIAWRLAVGMRGLQELRGHTEDSIAVHQIGWASARAIGDRHAQGWILNGLGTGYWHREAYAKAIDRYQKALAIRTELADDRGVAVVLNNLGSVYGLVGRYDEAIDSLRRALAIRDQLGDKLDKSFALNSLGHLLHERGLFAEALPYLEEALRIRRDLCNRNGAAATLHCLGDTLAGLGRMTQSLACYRQALTTFRQLGNRYGEAVTLHSIGSVCRGLGRPGQARRYLESAIARYTELGQQAGEAAARKELARTAPL